MAGNIRGITIEFAGDTTKLDKALRQIKNSTKDIDAELKQVNKALKFNPTSVELWRQKQDLLKQKIKETENNLKELKNIQAQMDASGVDKNSEAYRRVKKTLQCDRLSCHGSRQCRVSLLGMDAECQRQ